MINYLALAVALALSAVSGYYSIIGLTTIFSSAFYPVLCMGIVLEMGKLVSASWLYNNWYIASKLLKTYLTLAVIVLMFITSMGIFGFLAKAHIEQSLSLSTGVVDQVKVIESKIKFEKERIEDLDKQVAQIDSAINEMVKRGRATSSLRAAAQQRKTRVTLVNRKEEYVRNISKLTEDRIKLQSNIKKLEAEVGPIRYITEMVYEGASTENLERSVRAVILIIVFVFDPLAVILLIAANAGIVHRRGLGPVRQPAIMKIDNGSF